MEINSINYFGAHHYTQPDYRPPAQSLYQKAEAAEIKDSVFRANESYKEGMRTFKFMDSKTTASESAVEAVKMLESATQRSSNIMKVRLMSNL
jgi:hypothetical protein